MAAKTIVLFQRESDPRPELLLPQQEEGTASRGNTCIYPWTQSQTLAQHPALVPCWTEGGKRGKEWKGGAGRGSQNELHVGQRVLFFASALNVKTVLTLA